MGTVLAIDDDPVILDLFQSVIESNTDHTVIKAANGLEAAPHIKEADLIFLDINLPLLQGIDFIQQMRDLNKHAPICVMTAFMHAHREELDGLLGNKMITKVYEKPLDRSQILLIVHEHLKNAS